MITKTEVIWNSFSH